ncbi:MAG: hypothetical protein UY65_C0005G0013 [Parcubacteria group bacterium GW2011_GWA2_51_12]|nr:MAG: hypothetical protein UY65_C0005G0013 [Parcubacteria group bacterium GW2011_GWA2_51_12]
MRKFSLLQIVLIAAALIGLVYGVDKILTPSPETSMGVDTSDLPSVTPAVDRCIAEAEEESGSYPSIVVDFYRSEGNINKANALLQELGFPNKLGAVAGKTNEVWVSVVRDESNILEEFFQGNKEAYEYYLRGELRRANPDASFAVDRRIHEADERLLRLIEQHHGDRWDSINTRSFGVPTYIVRLGVHMTLEEVRERFGGNSQVEVDYSETFYHGPIDFQVGLHVRKGTEVAWMCYLREEHSDLIQDAYIMFPPAPSGFWKEVLNNIRIERS